MDGEVWPSCPGQVGSRIGHLSRCCMLVQDCQVPGRMHAGRQSVTCSQACEVFMDMAACIGRALRGGLMAMAEAVYEDAIGLLALDLLQTVASWALMASPTRDWSDCTEACTAACSQLQPAAAGALRWAARTRAGRRGALRGGAR